MTKVIEKNKISAGIDTSLVDSAYVEAMRLCHG